MHTLSRRGAALAAPVLALAALVFAFGGAEGANAATVAVSIDSFAFGPASVTVATGDTVTWTNNEAGIPHTATSDTSGVFNSGTLNSGVSFSHTFTTAGTFTYHCNIHPAMTGSVTVTGAAAATATTAAPTATTAAATATTATATTAAATATRAAPSATTAATQTAPPVIAPAPTSAGSPSAGATASPLPPATGDSGSDGGSSTAWLVGGAAALAVAAVGGGLILRRRQRI